MPEPAPSADPDPYPADARADDLARLSGFAAALADGVERALPAWVVGSVARTVMDDRGEVDSAVLALAEAAGHAASAEIMPRLRALLDADIDTQRTNPLAVIRGAVRFPTEVLLAVGVPPVARDAQAARHFPDDLYDLAPAAFADLDPALHEPGLLWGAAKAHIHLRRRRAEGRR